MDAIDAILTRRSIRKFTNEPVTDEQVETLLKAAMYAPSAGNQQPWHFIVVQDRAILDSVPDIHPYTMMIKQAPLAVIVCGDLQKEMYEGYWVQDCSAATENLLLAAHAMGLGAVWCGIFPRGERVEGIIKMFNLPDKVLPLCVIPIGWPAEEKGDPERMDPSRIHLNVW